MPAPKMTCPACGGEFPRFTSLRLSPFKPIGCGHCGAQVKRANKLVPLAVAVVGILAYGYLQAVLPLGAGGNILLMFAILAVALLVDEATARLEVVAGPTRRPGG